MIRRLEINGLFNRFDYDVVLKEGGTTIITGPNGFGKSTILKIIDKISTASILFFYDLDFNFIKIFFDDESVKIEKKDEIVYFDGFDMEPIRKTLFDYNRFRRRPYIRSTPNGYIDIRTGKKINVEDQNYLNDELFWEEFIENFANRNKTKNRNEMIRSFLKQLSTKCGQVKMISEQRLIEKDIDDERDTIAVDVIERLPDRLKKEIYLVTDEYSKVANRLDSSYPTRLFATTNGLADKSEYTHLITKINEKFKNLTKYNLVELEMIPNTGYVEEYSKALKIYFEDFDEKYQVFSDLIRKLDLFTRIINSRLQFKEIVIDRENGFIIVDSDSKNTLDLTKLSSGEKQEIVLFYDLIFNADEEILLLIDEPEISLHISWQKKFMDDLLNIAKETKIQSIVATHSPQIVSNHLDIQIDLGELYQNGLD